MNASSSASSSLLLGRSPLNSYAMLKAGAAIAPDAPALSFFLRVEDHVRPFQWTHSELMHDINRVANTFRRCGLQRGDVIAMLLPNVPEAQLTIWGGEASSIVMPINPLLEPAMIANLLQAAQVKALVTLAPTPDTDIWQKACQVMERVSSLQMVFTVSPMKYYRGILGRALAIHSRLKTPMQVNAIPVFDFHAEMEAASGESLVFEPPNRYDIASYFCTGGTTGLPKIAKRTHETEASNSEMVACFLGDELGPGTTLFCGLPLFHVNAQLGSGLIPWYRGAHVVLGTPQGYRAPGLIQRFWEVVEHHRIASFSGVPTVYSSLMKVPKAGRDLSSLRVGLCGAAPLPAQLRRQFESETGIRILEGYGLTEAGCVSTLNPRDGSGKDGSIGVCLPGQRLISVILDEEGRFLRDADPNEVGILAVHGQNTFAGYLDPLHEKDLWIHRKEHNGLTLRWLNTGDMGRIDEDGFVFLTGRKKELIIRAGHNIDPRLIEDAIHAHPAVALAAAVGRPDSYAGEVPALYVQLHPGAHATSEELLNFAQSAIAERAAIPKRVQILAALPTTAVGKVFKPALTLLEIEDVIREEARTASVELTSVEVVQDPKKGFVAYYQGHDPQDRLKKSLDLYTFAARRSAVPQAITEKTRMNRR